jgi:hypothetical protein
MFHASEILPLARPDTPQAVAAARHIAETIIRADARGQSADATRAYDRLCALVTTREDGPLVLLKCARSLGRKRALAVPLDKDVVETACRARWL